MKLCGSCGWQNSDDGQACIACGAELALPQSALATTLLLPVPPPPPPPPPPQPGLSGVIAPGHYVKPAGSRAARTMLGLAPPALSPAPHDMAPAPADAVEASADPLRGTVIGLAPVHEAPPPPPPPPAPPPTAPHAAPLQLGSAPRLPSAQRTVLGVARPGIAPLRPGEPKASAPAPAPVELPPPTATSRPPVTPVPPPSAQARAPRKEARRIGVAATLTIVGAAMLLTVAVVSLLMLRGRGAVTARATLTAEGKESLELSCPACPDGTKTWIDASPVSFQAGKATLPLRTPLVVGDNPIVLVLERPGRSREEIALSIPIEFRIRASTDELRDAAPKVSILAVTSDNTKLEVDGKAIAPQERGVTRLDYDVTEELTGPEASVKTLEKRVPYQATGSDGPVQSGEVLVRIGITPLVVDVPGSALIVSNADIVVAGRTAPGALLSVAGRQVTPDSAGRFVTRVALANGDNDIVVRATLNEHAPRLVPVRATRSASLERDAALLRAQAQATYADLAVPGESAIGRSVAIEGLYFDLRKDGYSSVLLLEVTEGCAKAPCLVKVVYGAELALDKTRKIRAFGKLRNFVDGPRSGERIPEIRAELVTTGGT